MAPDMAVQTLDFSQANPQYQSPLYMAFPVEIRLAIYALVLASFPDPNEPYSFQSYYYRPGHTAPKMNDLRLLSVCKRAYIEAKDLIWDPTSGNTQEAFWWGDYLRRPRNYRQRLSGALRREERNHPLQSLRTKAFRDEHWSKITKVEIFSQMYACQSETFKSFFDRVPSLQPKVVQLTIRYTDWWWWEENQALKLTIAPGKNSPGFLPNSCEIFLLELETIESKKDQLKQQVKMIADNKDVWKWPRMDGQRLAFDDEVKDWEWMGPTTFTTSAAARTFDHHPSGNEMKYCVKILTFKLS
ncbi:hypothetical protein H1R20_g13251, partial [Candolleomyces eurysporus]